jgi:hypothetical protein
LEAFRRARVQPSIDKRVDVVFCEAIEKGGLLAAFSIMDGRDTPGHNSVALDHEHPVVLPHVSHFMQVPFRTSV